MSEKLVAFKAEFFKALANPLRIRILDELRQEERTVSEIREKLQVELPNVSQQSQSHVSFSRAANASFQIRRLKRARIKFIPFKYGRDLPDSASELVAYLSSWPSEWTPNDDSGSCSAVAIS